MKKNFCREVLSLIFSIAAFTSLVSQYSKLKPGEAIPQEVWTTPLQFVNTPNKVATLEQDKGKLLLLDFWDIWCQACLINFSKMEKLQQDFGDEIKILAVTSQNRVQIEKFFSSKNGQRYNFQESIVEDKIFHTMFPHIGVPFIAWIKDGKVLTTTNAEQVTKENISKILDQETSNLQTVVQMTRERPLFLSEDFNRQQLTSMRHYSILTKGIVPDIGGGGAIRKNKYNIIYGRQFTNIPLLDIYYSIVYELFKQAGTKEGFTEKRIIYDVKNRENITGTTNADGTYKDLDNIYNYESIVPENQADKLYEYMLDDLNRYTDYVAKLELVKMDCYALIRTSQEDKIKTKGGPYKSTILRSPSILQNAPLKDFVNMINGNSPIQKILIDETEYTENVDIKLSAVHSIEQLNQELAKYHLKIIEAERNLLMLRISDKTKNHSAILKN